MLLRQQDYEQTKTGSSKKEAQVYADLGHNEDCEV